MARGVKPGTKRGPYKKKGIAAQEIVPAIAVEPVVEIPAVEVPVENKKKRGRPPKGFYDYLIESKNKNEANTDEPEMKDKIEKFIKEGYDTIGEIDVNDLDVLVTEKNKETPVMNASEIFSMCDIDMETDTASFEGYDMFNVTGHDIVTRDGITIKSVARSRIAETTTIEGYIYGVAVFKTIDTKKLVPKKMENRLYIVSSKVAQACPDRDDLLIPYEYNISRGNCLGLMRNPFYIDKK